MIPTYPYSTFLLGLCRRQMDLGEWQWTIVSLTSGDSDCCCCTIFFCTPSSWAFGLRFTPLLFFRTSHSDYITSPPFLILHFADGRSWVFLASIITWVNRYNKLLLYIYTYIIYVYLYIYIYILLVLFPCKNLTNKFNNFTFGNLHQENYLKHRKSCMKKDIYYNTIYIDLAQEIARKFWKLDYKVYKPSRA